MHENLYDPICFVSVRPFVSRVFLNQSCCRKSIYMLGSVSGPVLQISQTTSLKNKYSLIQSCVDCIILCTMVNQMCITLRFAMTVVYCNYSCPVP